MTTTITDNTNGAGGERLKPPSPGESGATPDASVRSSMDEWERRRYLAARITTKRLAEDAAMYLSYESESETLRAFYLQRAQASALASLALSQAFAS